MPLGLSDSNKEATTTSSPPVATTTNPDCQQKEPYVQPAASRIHPSITSCPTSPACCRTAFPPANTMKFGIPCTRYRAAGPCSFSVSTFSTTPRPAISFAVRATSGAAARQGPHHAAQKSTSTGTFAPCTISSNSAVVTAIGSSTGPRSALHAPHRPVSARCPAPVRFFCPQLLHVLMIPIVPPSKAAPNYSIKYQPPQTRAPNRVALPRQQPQPQRRLRYRSGTPHAFLR